jgi:succinoglycan biosynthesis protein ExoV
LFDEDESEIFVGIGTLLNHRLPSAPRKHIFGSGFGYGRVPKIDETWTVHALRGYDTANALKLSRDHVITDAAVLVALVDRPQAGRADRAVGYMPHAYSNVLFDWRQICLDAGLHFIDARWPVERVLFEISRCQRILTEAMHGAICADALRVPWVPVIAYDYISTAKWCDWLTTQDLPYEPIRISSLFDVERNHSMRMRLKSGTKRFLNAIGMDGSQWTAPPPRATGPVVREKALKELAAAARNSGRLSDDATLFRHLERYAERLYKVRRHGGAPSSVGMLRKRELRTRVMLD